MLEYVDKLLNGRWNAREVMLSDIGIVSPYREQCNFIKDECRRKGYDQISVGTAEIFQGQERHIIIISTVRTDGDLGFVKDERVSLVAIQNKI